MTVASLLGILTFLIGVPSVLILLYSRPTLRRPLLSLMAFGTCYVKKPLYMEIFFVPYRGVDRGFGVTIPDLILFGFLLWIILGGSKDKIIWWPYNTLLWQLLILVSIVSLLGSPVAYYGLFTLHKLIRGYLLFWVVVNLVRDRKDVEAVVYGVMAAVIFQTAIVFFDKYVTKKVVNRSVGAFPHPNTLAMYIDLIIPMVLSILLAGEFPKSKTKWAAIAILGGLLCVVFTKSRAALIIVGGSLAAVTFFSIVLKPTGKKVTIALVGFLLVDIMGIFAAPKIIERFQKAPEASEMTRVYFNHAARAMANDKLFGMGLNSYSWTLANTDYYWYVYAEERDEVKDEEEFIESERGQSRLGTAHHIYYLFAAETGWPGMIIFIMFIARYYLHNLILLFRTRDDYYQAILLGLFVGFSTLHLQGLLEWIFRQTQVFFLFCVLSGLMVATGNVMKLGQERQ
ncbi:MAG: O-antigen ligase family protein [Pseudomonadota bacterium]